MGGNVGLYRRLALLGGADWYYFGRRGLGRFTARTGGWGLQVHEPLRPFIKTVWVKCRTSAGPRRALAVRLRGVRAVFAGAARWLGLEPLRPVPRRARRHRGLSFSDSSRIINFIGDARRRRAHAHA